MNTGTKNHEKTIQNSIRKMVPKNEPAGEKTGKKPAEPTRPGGGYRGGGLVSLLRETSAQVAPSTRWPGGSADYLKMIPKLS